MGFLTKLWKQVKNLFSKVGTFIISLFVILATVFFAIDVNDDDTISAGPLQWIQNNKQYDDKRGYWYVEVTPVQIKNFVKKMEFNGVELETLPINFYYHKKSGRLYLNATVKEYKDYIFEIKNKRKINQNKYNKSLFNIESSTDIEQVGLFEETGEFAIYSAGWEIINYSSSEPLTLIGRDVCYENSKKTTGYGLGTQTFYTDCWNNPIKINNVTNESQAYFKVINSTFIQLHTFGNYDPLSSELSTGLISCWDFDDARDYLGNYDLSNNGVTFSDGKAIFDSSADYLNNPDVSTEELEGSTALTILVIHNLTSTAADQSIWSSSGTGSNLGWNYWFDSDSGGTFFTIFDNTGGGTENFESSTGLPTTNEQHTVMAWNKDENSGTAKFYVDGSEDTPSSSSAWTTALDAKSNFTIGEGLKTGFVGNINQMVIWKGVALNSSQVTELYNSGSGVTCAEISPVNISEGLVTYYDFEEGTSSSTAADSVGTNNLSKGNEAGFTLNTPNGTGFAGDLDGANDFWQKSSPTGLNINTGDDFSLTMDMYIESGANNERFILGDQGSSQNRYWVDYDGSNNLKLGHMSGSSYTMTTTVPTSSWFTFGWTFDNSADLYILYINGSNVENATGRTADDTFSMTNMFIGISFASPQWNVDNYRFYNKTINDKTHERIFASDFNIDVPSTPTNLTREETINFTGTFTGTHNLQCSGSIDVQGDEITYVIEKGNDSIEEIFVSIGSYITQDSDTGNDTITFSSENCGAECAADTFDRNTGTKWLTFTTSAWIKVQLGQGAKSSLEYQVCSANDDDRRDPDDWTIEGSNDDSSWTVLDTVTGGSSVMTSRSTCYDFTMDSPTNNTYTYYKWNITAVRDSGGGLFQVSELYINESEIQNKTITTYTVVGNHTEGNNYSWDLSTESVGENYEYFRCRAIDLTNSNSFSDYYTIDSNFTIGSAAGDSCSYSSGDWNVLCSDECSITSNVNLGGNNLLLTGTGVFNVLADIINYGIIYTECKLYVDSTGLIG